MEDRRLFAGDVASVTGLAWASVRTYRCKGIMPAPDGWEGARPWWRGETIEAWDQERTSRSGRPRENGLGNNQHLREVGQAAEQLQSADAALNEAIAQAAVSGVAATAIMKAAGLSRRQLARRINHQDS